MFVREYIPGSVDPATASSADEARRSPSLDLGRAGRKASPSLAVLDSGQPVGAGTTDGNRRAT
jgi:hypothetical protein